MATRERGEPCGVRSALDSASAHTLTTEPPRAQRTLRILSVTISAWIGRHHLCVLCALCGSRFNSSAPEPTTPDSLRPMQNLAEPSGNPAAICESIHSGRGPQSLSPLAVGQLAGGLRPSTVGSRPLTSLKHPRATPARVILLRPDHPAAARREIPEIASTSVPAVCGLRPVHTRIPR